MYLMDLVRSSNDFVGLVSGSLTSELTGAELTGAGISYNANSTRKLKNARPALRSTICWAALRSTLIVSLSACPADKARVLPLNIVSLQILLHHRAIFDNRRVQCLVVILSLEFHHISGGFGSNQILQRLPLEHEHDQMDV